MPGDNEKSPKRSRGTVTTFLPRKGYGFIKSEEGDRLFVHFSDIKGRGFRALEVGEEVEYTRVDGERGPQARDVVRLDPPKQPEIEPDPISQKKTW